MNSGQEARLPEVRGAYRAYLTFGLAVIVAFYLYHTDLAAVLERTEVLIGTLGPLAPLAMSVVAGIWATLCLPGPLMLGVIGTMFSEQLLIGIGVALAGDTIATIIGFQLARRAGRQRVRDWLKEKPWFDWLEYNAESRGAYGVFFLRMMPFFPNSLANYALGLTALRFWPYLIASVIGSIPNVALYVVGTAGTISLLREGSFGQFHLCAAALFLLLVALLVRGLQALLRRRDASEGVDVCSSNKKR